MKLFLILSILIQESVGFNLCVVGGKSGLGRELIFQSICKNKKVLALTNNSLSVDYPYRGGGLDLKKTNKKIQDNNLVVDTYDNCNKYKFGNIVFSLGAGPFENDYSDIVTSNILENVNNLFRLDSLQVHVIVWNIRFLDVGSHSSVMPLLLY